MLDRVAVGRAAEENGRHCPTILAFNPERLTYLKSASIDMLRLLVDEEGLPKASDDERSQNSCEIAWALALQKAKSGQYRTASHVEVAVRASGYSHEVNSWRDGWEQDRLNQLCRAALEKKDSPGPGGKSPCESIDHGRIVGVGRERENS